MAHLPYLVMEMFRLTIQALQQKLWDDLVIYETTLWRVYDGSACFCPPSCQCLTLAHTERLMLGGWGGQDSSGLIVDGH